MTQIPREGLAASVFWRGVTARCCNEEENFLNYPFGGSLLGSRTLWSTQICREVCVESRNSFQLSRPCESRVETLTRQKHAFPRSYLTVVKADLSDHTESGPTRLRSSVPHLRVFRSLRVSLTPCDDYKAVAFNMSGGSTDAMLIATDDFQNHVGPRSPYITGR